MWRLVSGWSGLEVGGHLASAFHEFSAYEVEVLEVAVFVVGGFVCFFGIGLLICGCRLILPPFRRRGKCFFGGLAIWQIAQLLAPVAQRTLGDTSCEVDIADMVADFEHVQGMGFSLAVFWECCSMGRAWGGDWIVAREVYNPFPDKSAEGTVAVWRASQGSPLRLVVAATGDSQLRGGRVGTDHGHRPTLARADTRNWTKPTIIRQRMRAWLSDAAGR